MSEMIENPMNVDDSGATRLGDEDSGLSQSAKARKKKNAKDAEDDGGEETVTHFRADVFDGWLSESQSMDATKLSEWAEVRQRWLLNDAAAAALLRAPPRSRRAPQRPRNAPQRLTRAAALFPAGRARRGHGRRRAQAHL